MAHKIQVLVIDDIDGGQAAETVAFGLDGVDYEIDLSERNAGKLRDMLAVYVAHGRKVGGRKTQRRRPSGAVAEPAEVREWARSHGIAVSERGRIAADVVAQYESAMAAH